MQTYKDTLSWQALGRIVITAALVLLAWKSVEAIVLILISLVLSVAMYPIVEKFHKKMPLLPATILVLLLLLIPLIGLIVYIVMNLTSQFPQIVEAVNSILHSSRFLSSLTGNIDISTYLQNYSGLLLSSTKNIAITATEVLTVFFLSFYLIYDYKILFNLFLNFFSNDEKKKVTEVLSEVARVTGLYVRGNVLISIISGVVIYIGLLLLHIPFALPLALFTAVLDLLPLVGPTIGSLPAILIGFAISPFQGFLVIILYFTYQQLENVFISPVIYNQALNLSPALTFLAVVIGGTVFGIIGALFALPVAASIPVLMKYKEEYTQRHQEVSN
ncbi:AI-2E family transporter [Patescibacteria group bacterium]|nr:AI-2E family transporter [Patescibacteria group bacterium]